MSQVEPPKKPDYHFLTDMTDKAIDWAKAVKSLTPEKPFFIYYAPGATHAPHHVPKDWIAKYKGQFDHGWDKLREETLARQKELGVVPPETQLAKKPAAIKDWDKLDADEKKLFAHQMEVFAGYGEFADHEAGRLIHAIEDMGQLDNTLVFFIAGDNGASAEGGMNGLFNESTYFNGVSESVADVLKHYDELGVPRRTDIMRPAGLWPATLRFNGQSRSRRIMAVLATGWSSTGPDASKRATRFGRNGITSSTSRRRFWKPRDCPSRKPSMVRRRRRLKA